MNEPNDLGRTSASVARAARFGPFVLILDQPALMEGSATIRLGSRALKILAVLVDRAGEIVDKADLVRLVWPGITVEEVALRVHVSALRRALGDGRDGRRYLVTVPGRGYKFVGDISPTERAFPPASMPEMHHNLPQLLSRVVGRDRVTKLVAAELSQHGMVTIIGPGGIGKTTVAVAVAAELMPLYPDGIHFVDLASGSQANSVSSAVALAMGYDILADDALPGLVASLRAKRALLLLDSCERVAADAAVLVEHVRREAPGIHILATSREALRADGERVVTLPPLELPLQSASLTVADAMASPAVQLFIERATAASNDFMFADRDAPVVADICTRLDGVALAIELAAAQVVALDLRSIARLLEDRFRLLARGRRTALQRHQTMAATLDWSYEALPAREQLVLCRLSVFEGAITLAAAEAVVSDDVLVPADVVEAVARLIDRSLLSAAITEDGVFYRLLDTTCAYVATKLAQRGETNALARRHALEQLRARLAGDAAWSSRTNKEWLLTYRREIGDVRAAMDWAFSEQGDVALAVTLSAAALPMLFELSLAEECRRRATQALAAAAGSPLSEPRESMRLRAVLAAAQMYTPGPSAQTIATWDGVLTLARELGDQPAQSRALWGLWTGYFYGGMPSTALLYARQLRVLAAEMGNEARLLMAERILGISLHYLGEQEAAAKHLAWMIARYDPQRHRFRTLGFPTDHGLLATATLARVLWVRGCPDQALATSRQVLEVALDQDYAISSGYVLLESAFPVSVFVGDLDGAETALDELAQLAARGGVAIWQAGEGCARLALQMTRGEPVPIEAVNAALSALRATGYRTHETWLCGMMAEALGNRGDFANGLALVDQAITRCDQSGEQWCVPDLHRIRGDLLARQDPQTNPTGSAAMASLRESLEAARRQNAPSFELRAAISMLRLEQGSDQRVEARTRLASVLARFEEGFGTADLLRARKMLSDQPD